jgi:hypothetical protein
MQQMGGAESAPEAAKLDTDSLVDKLDQIELEFETLTVKQA